MAYQIFISKSAMQDMRGYFNTTPFFMKASFSPAEMRGEPGGSAAILLGAFRGMADSDYEYRTPSSLSFRSAALLDILHATKYNDRLSLVYLHSHASKDCRRFENCDCDMIFRIMYAYLPFGFHANLYYVHGEMSGDVWLPDRTKVPADIIVE